MAGMAEKADTLRNKEAARKAVVSILRAVKDTATQNETFAQIVAMFPILFNNILESDKFSTYSKYKEAADEFLSAIGLTFHRVKAEHENLKDNTLNELGLEVTEIYNNGLNFWLYLSKVVYPHLKELQYSRKDNIFKFALGFPINETRILMMLQDPAQRINSRGCALYKNPCETVNEIIKYLVQEMQLLNNAEFTVTKQKIKNREADADLSYWKKERVLLVNARLTLGDTDDQIWVHFRQFLVKYIEKNCPNVLFVLCCFPAHIMDNYINNWRQIIKVRHPVAESSKKPRWDDALPFLKAAYFRYRNTNEIIDWWGIFDDEKDQAIEYIRQNRRHYLKKVFDKLKAEGIEDITRANIAKITVEMNLDQDQARSIETLKGSGGSDEEDMI